MFWGEYSHTIDDKGRLIIPARFRPRLTQGAVLTRGIDRNLTIYPNTAWNQVVEQLNSLPITHPTARAMRRLLFSGAVDVRLDKQGRLLIPVYLREYASLSDGALLVGMETFIEIWEPLQWRSVLDDMSKTLAQTDSLIKFNV